MTDLLLTALATVSMLPVDAGVATTYAPGVMETVIENRVAWGQLDPDTFGQYRGFVALQSCDLLGRTAWLYLDDGRLVGPYLVADCGKKSHQAELDAMDFAVDLSHEVAGALGLPREVMVYVEADAPGVWVR